MYWHVNTNKGNIVEECRRTVGACPFGHFESYEEAMVASAAVRRQSDYTRFLDQCQRFQIESENRMVKATDPYNPFSPGGMATVARRLDELEDEGFTPEWQSYRVPVIYPSHERNYQNLFFERLPHIDSVDGSIDSEYRLVAVDRNTGDEMVRELSGDEFDDDLRAAVRAGYLSYSPDGDFATRQMGHRAAIDAVIDARISAEDESCTDFSGGSSPDPIVHAQYESRLPSNYRYVGDDWADPYNPGDVATSFFRDQHSYRMGEFNLANSLVRPRMLRRFMTSDDQASTVDIGIGAHMGFSWTNDEAGTSPSRWTLRYNPDREPAWSTVLESPSEGVSETPVEDPNEAAERIAAFTYHQMPHGRDQETADRAAQWVRETIIETDKVVEEARNMREESAMRNTWKPDEGEVEEPHKGRRGGFVGLVKSLMG